MSSVRLVIVTESTADVFLTVTENVAVPPGSWMAVGLADFVTAIELGTLESVTTASSLSETELPSSSLPDAVTTSVCWLPAFPDTAPVNEQLYVAPGARICGTSHVPLPSRLPYTLSVRLVIVTVSTADVFLISTAKLAFPPGSGSEVGLAVFVTAIVLSTSVIRTVASSLSETSWPSSSLPDAVTTSVWLLPALPLTAPVNEQLYVAPGARICGTSQVPLPSRLP